MLLQVRAHLPRPLETISSKVVQMSGLPREVIRWLQSLDLSFPLRNVRRDFSNGYLIAEILAWYHPHRIQMHSYSNGTSLQSKLANWHLLEKVFSKVSIDIAKELIEGTIHCKPGAAIVLLENIYTLLTNRELHYVPAKGRPNDFSDRKYQSQLPMYARATTAQSLKSNLALTELSAEQDSTLSMKKAKAIIDSQNELKKLEKEEFPERFRFKTEERRKLPSKKALSKKLENEVPEVIVKQRSQAATPTVAVM